MTIKFTHKRKPTLIIPQNVANVYYDYDAKQQKRLVKIELITGKYVFVDESLEEVHKLFHDFKNGVTQEIDWDMEMANLDEMMEETFNAGRHFRGNNGYNQRNYNTFDNNNGGYQRPAWNPRY